MLRSCRVNPNQQACLLRHDPASSLERHCTRQQLLPRKDAAVAAVFKRWNEGEDVLPLLTSMQQELSALQQELATLENRRFLELQPNDEQTRRGSLEGPSSPADAHQQPTIIHIQTGKGRTTEVSTNSSELDLSRLEKENSIRVLKLAVNNSNEAPGDGVFQEPVAEALRLQAGQHVWVRAESSNCNTEALRHAILASAFYLVQLEAALVALSVIKRQVRGLAFNNGLKLLRKHWSGLASWFVSNVLAVEKEEAETTHKH